MALLGQVVAVHALLAIKLAVVIYAPAVVTELLLLLTATK